MEISDSHVLVTGANRGLGRALVEAALRNGAGRVYAAVRDATSLAQFSREPRLMTLEFDVTDAEQIEAAASRVARLDLLINNAGVLGSADPLSADLSLIERDLQVNFVGAIRVIRAFLPQLELWRGSIVNMLTLVSLASMPSMAVYSASKAAAYSMTQALRFQLGARGVHVHGVFPGAVDTDMIRHLAMPKAAPEDVAEQILAGVRAGEPDIFPDEMARQLHSVWQSDPEALAAAFANLATAA
jgi:NAD(P)-dependent dehydrogenase (short-subunit alcohol dehydrogenase family)